MIVISGMLMTALDVQTYIFQRSGEIKYFREEPMGGHYLYFAEIDRETLPVIRIQIGHRERDCVLQMRQRTIELFWVQLTANESEFGMTFDEFDGIFI